MVNLKNKTVRSILIIATLLVFVMIMHFVVGRLILFKKLREEKIKAEELQQKLKDSQNLVNKFPNPKSKIEEIKGQMEELKKKSVSEKELPRIIQQLTKKSSELKIEIISIKPIKKVPFKEINLPHGVSKAYIEVVLKTNYITLGEYFKSLQELPIIFTIESVALERSDYFEEEDFDPEQEVTGQVVTTLLISSYTIWQI